LTAETALLLSRIIMITSICSLAMCALAVWSMASRSTRSTKRPNSPEATHSSAIAALQADQAALFSTLEKLTTTVKRLSSRQGMRDGRAEPEVPPVGTPKQKLREFYGLTGKSPAQVAAEQFERERAN